MAKVQIGSNEFKTKKAAKDFYRSIRDKYVDGEVISSDDAKYLFDMVGVHHQAEAKFGCGISHFTVETDSQFGNSRHFMIHRIDGTQTDVSFLTAIDGSNKRRDQYSALRDAVNDQITSFKHFIFDSGETIICPFRGIQITASTCHIDHIAPLTFYNLAEQWMKKEGLCIEQIEITPSSDNQIVTVMTNAEQIESWQKFHATNAKLRALSKIGNLSDAKKVTT